MSRTRWPCSLSSRARVCEKRMTPPRSSMLFATMKTSRGRLLVISRAEEQVVDDPPSRVARVVLAEVADEVSVALLVVLAPGGHGRKGVDQLVARPHERSRRQRLEVPVDAALVVRVLLVVV